MKFIDMHCDTIAEIFYSKKTESPLSLADSALEVDINKLKKGGAMVQNFALFTNLSRTDSPFSYCSELADVFDEQVALNPESIVRVKSFSDILKAEADNKIAALLTVEEGAACEGDADKLQALYNRGVRMMTLTWNYENMLAFPNTRPAGGGYEAVYNKSGLKPAGRDIVAEMVRLGIIIDVSHLSDGGFWDICELTSAPFVASHSNARALCSHPRNLDDDMIKALAKSGGVMGINYFGPFLRDENPRKQSCVSDMIRHISHIRNVGGIGCIGLGSDFDGISGELEIRNCSEVGKLADAMLKAGFTEREVEAVFYKNVLNLYREVLR